MMLKGKDIIGNPIMTGQQKDLIATVNDIFIDPEARRVIGFLVCNGGWAGGAQVLSYSEVVSVSDQRVVARTTTSIVEASTIPQVRKSLERGHRLQQSRIDGPAGSGLGMLTDVYFDSQTGEISDYEVIEC